MILLAAKPYEEGGSEEQIERSALRAVGVICDIFLVNFITFV